MHIDPTWKENVIKILDKIKKNKVVLIGFRVSEHINWSVLMKEMNIDDIAESKMVSVLYFKIGEEYRLEIYEQLEVLLTTIKNLLFSY